MYFQPTSFGPIPRPNCGGAWATSLGYAWAYRSCLPKTSRTGLLILGPVPFGANFHTTVGDRNSLLGSVISRVLLLDREPNTPKPNTFIDSRIILEKFQDFSCSDKLTPWSFDYWVSRFSASQRGNLIHVKNCISHGRPCPRNKRTIFTKGEKKSIRGQFHYPSWGTGAGVCTPEHVDDRNITACTDEDKVRLGPWCCALAQRIASLWSFKNWLFFDLDATDDQIGEWYTSKYRLHGEQWAFELDCSRIDASHREQTLALAFWIFRRLGLPQSVIHRLNDQLNNIRSTSRSGVAFIRRPFLQSGVPNTTITNTVAVAAAFTVGLIRSGGIPGVDGCLMVKGDDCFGFLNPKFVEGVRQSFVEFGFVPKIKSGHPQVEHSFCSNVFYPVDGGFSPAPTLRALRSMFVSYTQVPPHAYRSHILGVCLGLRHIVKKIPIFHQVVELVISQIPRKYDKYFHAAEKITKVKLIKSEAVCPPTRAAYQFVATQLHLSIATVEAIERDYCAMVREAYGRDCPACVVWSPLVSIFNHAIEEALIT